MENPDGSRPNAVYRAPTLQCLTDLPGLVSAGRTVLISLESLGSVIQLSVPPSVVMLGHHEVDVS